jgi:hypothetical protein
MAPAKTYRESFEGWLSGLMQWDDVEAVLHRIAAEPEGWWIYETARELPVATEPPASLRARLDDILAFLRRHHRADYCGFAYVDDKTAPALLKVYDPRNASACSLAAPLPVFTISRARPERLPFDAAEAESVPDRGLFGRLFKGVSSP